MIFYNKLRTLNLIKSGSGLLILQNLLFIFVWTSVVLELITDDGFFNIYLYITLYGVFVLDLIGFLLLGSGFLKYSWKELENSRSYKMAALGILGWLFTRIYMQTELMIGYATGQVTSRIDEYDLIFLFSLSSLCLFISGLSRIHTRYLYFTALNFAAVWITTISYLFEIPGLSLEITIFIKLVTVPVLAIFVFRDLYMNNPSRPKSEKYTTEIYPVG